MFSNKNNLKGPSIGILYLYQKLGGEPIQGEGQIMARSLWAKDKTPSMSINTHKNVFNDKSTGIKGNVFNMVIGRSGRLTNREIFECHQKINKIMGNIESPTKPIVERKPVRTYDQSEAWDFIYAWHEMRQAMLDTFPDNKKILAMMYRYLGHGFNFEMIEHIVTEYNIGWCAVTECLAIPYICNGSVSYIDLIKWAGDGFKEKKVYCYPLKNHIEKHAHLNTKNSGFNKANELKKFSKIRLASSIKKMPRVEGIKRKPHEPLLICEGFKDAMVATAHGFNAISGASGAMSFESYENESVIEQLKKRSSIGICFDNDEAGKTGARELKALLEKKGAQNVNIVDLGDVCTGRGEDLTDYFMKYKGCKKHILEQAMGSV